MNAFETELGIMTEIAEAVNELGWLLPTDIQSEAIPLILGGGDILMAAETGSGKTGAFCLPVLQIVYETLKELQNPTKSATTSTTATKSANFKMNVHDRTTAVAIDEEGLLCQSRDASAWHGCRANKGVIYKGRYYYEATVTDEGLCRIGWSTQDAALDLGTDKLGFGFGGTGKKSNNRQFDEYGESYGKGDVIGCSIDLDASGDIKWFKNGKDLGKAYTIPANLKGHAFYPAMCMKNAELKFNFGECMFAHMPKDGCVGIAQAPSENTANSPKTGGAIKAKPRGNNAPLALIIEPSKELAEQTFKQIQMFKKNLSNPSIRELLIVGGIPMKEQMAGLERGVDIVVATPGRLDDLISSEKISLGHVKFYVLDEVDGLLLQGHKNFIVSTYKRIPLVGADSRRLQLIVCSATLHNFEVKKMAEQIMHYPTWIDLKGQDSVPDTIHHCVCIIDPKEDTSWRSLTAGGKRCVATDGVHATDKLNYSSESREMLSEAVKMLKGEYCVRAIEKYQIDKALIFCRTKLDCDNLEQYFNSLGRNFKPPAANPFSCVCLHSDRSASERTENLEKFKQNKVRMLICTDVAARGIDITGLPYVINVTLPDEKQNYIHRIGRVGRTDRMGLAISLVSKVQEKVWYHTCSSRGKNCTSRHLKEEGGCCTWYNEMLYLDEIEEHLGCTISQIPKTLEVPVNEFDGKVVYGERKQKTGSGFKGHTDQLADSVRQLIELEKKTQKNFLEMKMIK